MDGNCLLWRSEPDQNPKLWSVVLLVSEFFFAQLDEPEQKMALFCAALSWNSSMNWLQLETIIEHLFYQGGKRVVLASSFQL